MTDIILELRNVVKTFDKQEAVKNITLQIHRGEFLTLLGPSGCGKTTTLRMIAGFENPTEGVILLEGQHVENKQPHERDVNTVFQSYALFPHMNVYDNIAYSLKIKKVKKMDIQKRVFEMLSLVQLNGYEKRMPDQLSGGQKQRVAIARALINKPKVLLLDEPLGALDFQLRKQMQIELKNLQKTLGITFIYVTHDQEEALNMSDRIAVINKGSMEQLGTPKEIYDKPKTRFVAGFIGESNIFEATVKDIEGNIALLEVAEASVSVETTCLTRGKKVYISVRPENMAYELKRSSECSISATVKEYNFAGSLVKSIAILTNGHQVLLYHYDKKAYFPEVGTKVWLTWKAEAMTIVPEEAAADDAKN